MGTDIHAVAQANINGVWVDIESKFDEGRHYKLFSHLAGVRNGVGFAGCDTGEAVNPIQEDRGFPDDFTSDDNSYGDGHNGQWMGDHSYGWVSAYEVINHDWGQGVSRGVISLEAYKKWDGDEPNGYCGMIGGRDILVSDDCENLPEGTTHVRVEWKNSSDRFDYFVDEVAQMVSDNNADVRIVFGFDS